MTRPPQDQRFLLRGLLGRGAMASVYRAHDQSAQMDVALKVLHPHLADDPGLVEAFEREARLMQSLDHPSILRVFELTQIQGRPAIVMELCPGGDLKGRLLQRGRFTEEEALAVMTPVLEALEAIHERGILHRDIKPANILFDADDRPRLTDFGIGQAEELLASEASGQLGTVEYMAPERLDGFALDSRSDIYSVGVTLFELLCGHPPYRGDTAADVMRMHRDHLVADPSLFQPGLSPHINQAIQRALATHPEDRFASARELIQSLQGARTALLKPPEAPLWRDLKAQLRQRAELAASLDDDGQEWLLYLPPSSRYLLYGPDGDARLQVLGDLLTDYPLYSAIPLDTDELSRKTLRRLGIARGLSRQGAEELSTRLENKGLMVRLGRRPRTRPVELRETLANLSLKAATLTFFLFALLWFVATVSALFFADLMEARDVPEQLRLGLVFSGALAAGVFAGFMGLPAAIREWWIERFSTDYLLDFAIDPGLNKGLPVGEREATLLQRLQSPRIRASFDRALHGALHLDDPGPLIEELARRATRITELESRVTALRPGQLSAQIRQLDQRLAAEHDASTIEDLLDEKTTLRQRLTERDDATLELEKLSQEMHETSTRLTHLAIETST